MSKPTPVAYALGLYDAATALLPRRWSRCDLRFVPLAADGLAFHEVEGIAPAGSPSLTLDDQGHYGALAAQGADLLRQSLYPAGVSWSGQHLSFVREAGAYTLELLDRADQVVHHIHLPSVAAARVPLDGPLLEALIESQSELWAAQEEVASWVGDATLWSYDEVSSSLLFSGGSQLAKSAEAQLVGTYVNDRTALLWPWHNTRVAPESSKHVGRLRSLGLPELRVMDEQAVPAGPNLALLVACLVARHLRVRGIYPARFGDGIHFFAVIP